MRMVIHENVTSLTAQHRRNATLVNSLSLCVTLCIDIWHINRFLGHRYHKKNFIPLTLLDIEDGARVQDEICGDLLEGGGSSL